MSAEREDMPQQGLVGKYLVARTDGDPSGKHEHCRYFVLDPTHDPIARPAMKLYAQLAASEGQLELARDLEAFVDACAQLEQAERNIREFREAEARAAAEIN